MYEEILSALNVAVYVNKNDDKRIVSISFSFQAKKCESVRSVTAEHSKKEGIILCHILSLVSFVFLLNGFVHIC